MDELNNINHSNDGTQENSDNRIIDAKLISSGSKNNMQKPPVKRKRWRIFTYVIVGIICCMIGGAASGFGVLYYVTNSDSFKNTQFYKSLVEEKAKDSRNGSNISSSSAADLTSGSSQNAGGNLTTAEIAKKVGPAVVGISTNSGSGSGIIIDKSGLILTNYHVIDGTWNVKITFSNSKTASAKVVNYDQDYDLAIVKITDKNITIPGVAELGDSDKVQVGDTAIAIGNPLGTELQGSVTQGIISAVNRTIDSNNKNLKFIQTDAAINPGNSGGALVNSKGQVIGINREKVSAEGVEGLGFAIPINVAKSKIASLSKPILKLGIAGTNLTQEEADENGVPVGFYVSQVDAFSAAAKAGIQADDIITKFDGVTVKSVDDINTAKNKHKSGDIVSVEVYRDGSTKALKLTLTE